VFGEDGLLAGPKHHTTQQHLQLHRQTACNSKEPHAPIQVLLGVGAGAEADAVAGTVVVIVAVNLVVMLMVAAVEVAVEVAAAVAAVVVVVVEVVASAVAAVVAGFVFVVVDGEVIITKQDNQGEHLRHQHVQNSQLPPGLHHSTIRVTLIPLQQPHRPPR